ncbi:hypothetical protein EPN90_01545 [Patescibacteria group bacterium]|nr:MAG: hypothetical protein EPN90_01545 [Patescibacteria group bacterium]
MPTPAAVELLPLLRRRRVSRHGRRIPNDFLSIAGAHDLLAPPARCRHPDAENVVLPVDHAGLVIKKDVFRRVHAFLAST